MAAAADRARGDRQPRDSRRRHDPRGAARAAAASVARSRNAWALIGAPLDGTRATRYFVDALWDLLKGGASLKVPAAEDLSRRFAELLNDNLGQPGFSELLLTVHDLDARRDLVFGLVREPFRRALFPPRARASRPRRPQASPALGGLRSGRAARDYLIEVMRAALSVPGMTEPALVRFAPDGYWRGEVHRLVDRPASLGRCSRKPRPRASSR